MFFVRRFHPTKDVECFNWLLIETSRDRTSVLQCGTAFVYDGVLLCCWLAALHVMVLFCIVLQLSGLCHQMRTCVSVLTSGGR